MAAGASRQPPAVWVLSTSPLFILGFHSLISTLHCPRTFRLSFTIKPIYLSIHPSIYLSIYRMKREAVILLSNSTLNLAPAAMQVTTWSQQLLSPCLSHTDAHSLATSRVKRKHPSCFFAKWKATLICQSPPPCWPSHLLFPSSSMKKVTGATGLEQPSCLISF